MTHFGLQSGDTIGIAAPASPFDKKLFQQGISVLQQWGFEIFHQPDIFSEDRYLAGNDQRRSQELQSLFENKKIKAILFARGGFGTQRILPLLNRKAIQKNPKIVIGCSDLTPLLHECWNLKLPAFYGPVVTQLGKNPTPRTLQSLKTILQQGQPNESISLQNCQILKPGKARGRLVGGCLSLISTSLQTPYAIEPNGDILFFEDVDEKVYAIDRMLTQLKNSELLKKCAGIIIGSLLPKDGEAHSMEAMLKNCLKDFDGPIVTHFPAGHSNDVETLPLGLQVMLDTEQKQLSFL